MGVFSLEEYTHFTPKRGLILHGIFWTTVLGLCGTVAMLYEDKPSAPRTFEGGLEAELGGPNAFRVSFVLQSSDFLLTNNRPAKLVRTLGEDLDLGYAFHNHFAFSFFGFCREYIQYQQISNLLHEPPFTFIVNAASHI